MGDKHKLKKPKVTKAKEGGKIKLSEDNKKHPSFDYPVFCFRYLHKDFDLSHCDVQEKTSLIERLIKLSQLTWNQIQQTDKHGLGSEKIQKTSIKTQPPTNLCADVGFLIALRFDGRKPIVGHRGKNNVFHIYYIDKSFCLYNH